MTSPTPATLKSHLTQKRVSCSLDKEELKRFCEILQERSTAAGGLEVTNFQQLQQTDELYEQNKRLLYEAFTLSVTIKGEGGEELFGSVPEVFGSPNFPERVLSVYVNSETRLQVNNYYPRNGFSVFLDFSKPALFDFSLLPSASTPNSSNVSVQGYDSTWANGVFSEVTKFLSQKAIGLKFLHQHSIYDLFVWFVGIPFAFWAASKASLPLEELLDISSGFALGAAYLYLGLAALLVVRVLFHYARWVWPLVEYRSPGNRALRHRLALAALSVGAFGNFVSDIVKYVVTSMTGG